MTQTTSVFLTGVNDAPVLSTGPVSPTYTENQPAIVINSTVAASDIDNLNLLQATVSITGNFQSGADVLGFVNQNGIIGSYNGANGVLTLSGTASIANYQDGLVLVTHQQRR